jgi:hypothetical protein
MLRPLIFVVSVVAVIAVAVIAAGGFARFGQAQAVPTPRALATGTAPPNTPTLTIVGPTGPIAPGARFDAQVVLNSPVVSRGVQFGLSYDPQLIQITGVDEGDYYRSWAQANGASTALVPGVNVDAQNGWLTTLGIALLGGTRTAGPSGTGTLAVVHLQALAGTSGTPTLTFQDVLMSVPYGAGVAALPAVQVTDGALTVGSSTKAVAATTRLLRAYTPAPWTKRPANWPTPHLADTPAPRVATWTPGRPNNPLLGLTPVPTIPTTLDLAPQLARGDAIEVIVHFLDGHEERWLADPSQNLNDVRARLPVGATIRMIFPPAAMIGHQPLPPPTRTASSIPVTRDLVPYLPASSKYVIVVLFSDGHIERWLADDRLFSDLRAYLPAGARILDGYGPYSTMANGQEGSTPVAGGPVVSTTTVLPKMTATPIGANR